VSLVEEAHVADAVCAVGDADVDVGAGSDDGDALQVAVEEGAVAALAVLEVDQDS